MKDVFEELEQITQQELSKNPDSAHDFEHVKRVYNLALTIAKKEKDVNLNILKASTLLHDIGCPKEQADKTGKTDHAVVSSQMSAPILKNLGFDDEQIKKIQHCIICHRFKTDNIPTTIEAKILFDADKLDTLGAIGIARAFCWVGRNRAYIYKKTNIDEYVKENMHGKTNGRIKDKSKHSTQIEYEVKTKFLKDKFFTQTAKEICNERLKYFTDFLDRLENEVLGKV